MFIRIAGVIVVGKLLILTLHAQATPDDAGAGKPDDSYWIVETKDAMSYRAEPGSERPIKGHYTPLHPSDEVFCTVDTQTPAPPPRPEPARQAAQGKQATKRASKLPALPPCSLNYITADSRGLLTDKIPANRWILMSSLADVPKPPRLVRNSRDLLEEVGKKAQRGGVSKGSGCAGTLPVMAPVCRETIDPADFALEWTDSPAGGNYATLFVDTIDELHSTSLRLDRIPLAAHRYDDARLRKFLEQIQKDSAPTNVLLRLSQSQDSEATRIVTIPSRADQRSLHNEIETLGNQQDLVRSISAISVYVKFAMWSPAGRQARELLSMGPDEELVMTYALVGFCQSGYTQETAELRARLRSVGVTDVCPEGQK